MSTNFKSTNRTSDGARFAAAPGPGHGLLNCKTLLCLALPLTLAAGCASGPSGSASAPCRPATAYSAPEAPATLVAPASERVAANQVVGTEIFDMFMTDMSINYSLGASVDHGMVTLNGTSSDEVERQRIVDRMWELSGVNQVKDELGVNVAPTLPRRGVVSR